MASKFAQQSNLKNSNARNKLSRIYLFVELSCLTQELLVTVKIFLYLLAIILSNFREIDRSANILRVFFNGMSKGQVDVMHNRPSSGDQVARVTPYKYFFTKCSRIVKYHHRIQEHHSKRLFYAKSRFWR